MPGALSKRLRTMSIVDIAKPSGSFGRAVFNADNQIEQTATSLYAAGYIR